MLRLGFYSHLKNQNKQPENRAKTLKRCYSPKVPLGRAHIIIKLIHLRVDNIMMQLSQFAQYQKNGQILALVQMTSVKERKYLNRKNVIFDPSSFLLNVLDCHSKFEQNSAKIESVKIILQRFSRIFLRGQFRNASRTIADLHSKLDKSSVSGQPSVQTPSKNSSINIPTAQRNNDPNKSTLKLKLK